MLNIERPKAYQSSITFFLTHPALYYRNRLKRHVYNFKLAQKIHYLGNVSFVDSYIQVQPKLISKETSQAEPEYVNIHQPPPPPPPQIAF